MREISILNDVLGPVMRGPSSSHTAGSYHLAYLARSILGDSPVSATIVFLAGGSYERVYREQGSDRAFAARAPGMADDRHGLPRRARPGPERGLDIRFASGPLPGDGHPNDVLMKLQGAAGAAVDVLGRSIGGGQVEIREIGGWPVLLTGGEHVVLVEADAASLHSVLAALTDVTENTPGPHVAERGTLRLLVARGERAAAPALGATLSSLPGVRQVWSVPPLTFAKRGSALVSSAAESEAVCRADGLSLGELGIRYEAALLGLTEARVTDAMAERLDVMTSSVTEGLRDDAPPMRLLRPTAGAILREEEAGRAAFGGMHARAAARAMAAMNVNCSMGVVCAAPTAGSARGPARRDGHPDRRMRRRERPGCQVPVRGGSRRHGRGRARHVCRRSGRLPGGNWGCRCHGRGRRRGSCRGIAASRPRRRRGVLPEYHGLGVRPRPGIRRDTVPHAKRRCRLLGIRRGRPRDGRLQQSHPPGRDHRRGPRRRQGDAARAPGHFTRRARGDPVRVGSASGSGTMTLLTRRTSSSTATLRAPAPT